jgi:hypothetical protein
VTIKYSNTLWPDHLMRETALGQFSIIRETEQAMIIHPSIISNGFLRALFYQIAASCIGTMQSMSKQQCFPFRIQRKIRTMYYFRGCLKR